MSKLPSHYSKFLKDYPEVGAAYKALGEAPDEIRHAVLAAVTTIGFPTMMAALSWVDDVLEPSD